MQIVEKIIGVALAACALVPLYTLFCVWRAGGDMGSPVDRFFVSVLALCGAMLILIIASR